MRRMVVQGPTTKRVIVTLKEGYSVDLFGQTVKSAAQEKNNAFFKF